VTNFVGLSVHQYFPVKKYFHFLFQNKDEFTHNKFIEFAEKPDPVSPMCPQEGPGDRSSENDPHDLGRSEEGGNGA
jgi:hypothetical protein